MKHLRFAALAALVSTSLGAQAQALANGDFGAGLTGWQTLGDVALLPAGSGSAAWLSTASVAFEDDFPLPAGHFNRSGSPAADVGVPGGVESFAGLALGGLDLPWPDELAAYEGSALRQSFVAQAGDTLQFRWNFATSDTAMPDYAFVAIDGTLYRLGGVAEAGLPGLGGHALQTGEQGFSLALAAGTHQITFGVVDVGDFNQSSTLVVGPVQVIPVPEPGALALMLAGLGLAAGAGRRRRYHQHLQTKEPA